MQRQKHGQREPVVLVSCVAILIIFALVSIGTGYSKLSPGDALRTLLGSGSGSENLILFFFRLPRIFLAMLVGCGLAISGCLLQGITRNPLADPGLLGINSGAGLVVVLYVLLGGTGLSAIIFALPALALVGAFGAAFLVYALVYKKEEGAAPFRMIMTGIAIQAGLSAFTTLLVIRLDDTQYSFVSSWQVGRIWGANWQFVLALLPWLCVLLPMAFVKAKALDIMALGEELPRKS